MAEETKQLTAAEIFERGRSRRIVPFGYMGVTLYAWGFKRHEAQAYREACVAAAGSMEKDAYSDERFVQRMVRDGDQPDAKLVFGPDDLLRLKDLNEADWLPLYRACVEANGWGAIGEESIRKNSETRNVASGSDSQPGTASAT